MIGITKWNTLPITEQNFGAIGRRSMENSQQEKKINASKHNFVPKTNVYGRNALLCIKTSAMLTNDDS